MISKKQILENKLRKLIREEMSTELPNIKRKVAQLKKSVDEDYNWILKSDRIQHTDLDGLISSLHYALKYFEGVKETLRNKKQ
jgi:hypothetical protein